MMKYDGLVNRRELADQLYVFIALVSAVEFSGGSCITLIVGVMERSLC